MLTSPNLMVQKQNKIVVYLLAKNTLEKQSSISQLQILYSGKTGDIQKYCGHSDWLEFKKYI